MEKLFKQMGIFLILVGIIVTIIGVVIFFFDKIPFLGKLPGDILIKRENFTFYFPVVTSILLSILISLVLYFLRK